MLSKQNLIKSKQRERERVMQSYGCDACGYTVETKSHKTRHAYAGYEITFEKKDARLQPVVDLALYLQKKFEKKKFPACHQHCIITVSYGEPGATSWYKRNEKKGPKIFIAKRVYVDFVAKIVTLSGFIDGKPYFMNMADTKAMPPHSIKQYIIRRGRSLHSKDLNIRLEMTPFIVYQ